MSQKTGKRVSEPLSLRCRRDRVKVAQVAGVLSIFVPHTQKNAFLSDQAGREANCPVQAFWEEAARPYIPNHGSKAQAKSIISNQLERHLWPHLSSEFPNIIKYSSINNNFS